MDTATLTGAINLSGASTITNASVGSLTLAGNITGTNDLTVNDTGVGTTISGVIGTGTGGLTKVGSGKDQRQGGGEERAAGAGENFLSAADGDAGRAVLPRHGEVESRPDRLMGAVTRRYQINSCLRLFPLGHSHF